MLFNSYVFILLFLPLTLAVYHGLRGAGYQRAPIGALTLASLFFYGWWNPAYLLLLVPMILANYALATRLGPGRSRLLLALGVAGDLGVLGYFKYANFFVDNVNQLFGMHLFLAQIVLPLGISFFTFQMIAFLVDAYRGRVDRLNLLDFSLFVSFFPQLIAGPIVHHSEMMPQFRRHGPVPAGYVAQGLTVFAIGLTKKVVLADTAALYATPQFAAVAGGTPLDLLAAWSAALAYTAQLYFDFSAYSVMAIGIGLLFGLRLPVNFASPYKATSIIEFWRRWHMTLSRFLRDYLYIPLGGGRDGRSRRYRNLMITMLLGGLWHGAGWPFVIWGLLHGLYLVVNHGWRALRRRLGLAPEAGSPAGRLAAGALTFLAVVVGWVFFRSADLDSALAMLAAMAGANGVAAPASLAGWLPGLAAGAGPVDAGVALLVSLALLAVAWIAPNTQELVDYRGPEGTNAGPDSGGLAWLRWRPTLAWATAAGVLLALGLMSLAKVSEFLYFQF